MKFNIKVHVIEEVLESNTSSLTLPLMFLSQNLVRDGAISDALYKALIFIIFHLLIAAVLHLMITLFSSLKTTALLIYSPPNPKGHRK